MSSRLEENLNNILEQVEANLLPENLKKGVSLLGVEGTLDEGVKLFRTIDDMHGDTSAKEDDLAIVYRSEIQSVAIDSEFQVATFPETVILPEALTDSDYAEIMFRAVDESVMFDCWGQLNSQMFMLDGWSDAGNIRIQYESSDGITYTRTTFEGNGIKDSTIDFGVTVHCGNPEMWNDIIGNFIKIPGNTFDGLFTYTLNCEDTNILRLFNASSVNVIETSGRIVEFSNNVDFVYYDTDKVLNLITNIYNADTSRTTYMLFTKGIDLYTICLNGLSRLWFDKGMNKITGFTFEAAGDFTNNTANIYKLDITNESYELIESIHPTVLGTTSFTMSGILLDMDYCGQYILMPHKSVIFPSISYKGTDSFFTLRDIELNESPYMLENRYTLTNNQLTLNTPGDILPGKIGYGKNGIIIGDGSIYNNLDVSKINNTYGLTLSDNVMWRMENVDTNALSYDLDNTANKHRLSVTIKTSTYFTIADVKIDNEHIIGVSNTNNVVHIVKTNVFSGEQEVLGSVTTENSKPDSGVSCGDYDADNNLVVFCIGLMNDHAYLVSISLTDNKVTTHRVITQYLNFDMHAGLVSAKNMCLYVALSINAYDASSSKICSNRLLPISTYGSIKEWGFNGTDRNITLSSGSPKVYDVGLMKNVDIDFSSPKNFGVITIGNEAYIVSDVDNNIHVYDLTIGEVTRVMPKPTGLGSYMRGYTRNDSFVVDNKVLICDGNYKLYDITNNVILADTNALGCLTKVNNNDVKLWRDASIVIVRQVKLKPDGSGKLLAFRKVNTGYEADVFYPRIQDIQALTDI